MHASRDEYRRFHRRRHRLLLELLAQHVPQTVDRCLDVGGGGDIADAADALRKTIARELHGVDLDSDVDRALERGLQALRCNVDLEPLPYPDAFFDLVILASVIEHLYNPHAVLREIARVLKPGGLFLIEAPNAVALGRRLDALAGHNPFRFFNQYNALENKALMVRCSVFYTSEEVEALLADSFSVLDRRYAMHDPPVPLLKRLAREIAWRVSPRLADCFFVVARRLP